MEHRGNMSKHKVDLYHYETWEALDTSGLIIFDTGLFLDTLATHSENSLCRFFFIPEPVIAPEPSQVLAIVCLLWVLDTS